MSAIEIRPSARQMRAPRLGRLFDSGTDALYTAFLTLDLIWRIGFRDRNKKVWCVAGAVALGSPESLRSCREGLSKVPCGGVSRLIRPTVGDARSAWRRRVGWRRGFADNGLRFHQFHPRAVGVVEIALPFAVHAGLDFQGSFVILARRTGFQGRHGLFHESPSGPQGLQRNPGN